MRVFSTQIANDVRIDYQTKANPANAGGAKLRVLACQGTLTLITFPGTQDRRAA